MYVVMVSLYMCIIITQNQDLFKLGQYVGMSILQGGSGFPFLSDSVYKYLSTGVGLSISVVTEEIGDVTLRFIINKVQCCHELFGQLW